MSKRGVPKLGSPSARGDHLVHVKVTRLSRGVVWVECTGCTCCKQVSISQVCLCAHPSVPRIAPAGQDPQEHRRRGAQVDGAAARVAAHFESHYQSGGVVLASPSVCLCFNDFITMFSAHFVVQLPQHASGLAAHWRYAFVPVRTNRNWNSLHCAFIARCSGYPGLCICPGIAVSL